MAYIPDPTDPTQPVGSVIAQTAAAEFRALKAYILGLADLPGGLNLYRKNKIINGNMLIDQRYVGTLQSVAVATAYPLVDKWKGVGVAAAGVFSAQQVAAAVADWSGAQNTLDCIVTTIDAAPAAGSFYAIYNAVESIDTGDMQWGTAAAKAVTLTFLVSASVIGTYSGSIRNSAKDRSYPFTFTVDVVDTVEQKTITIPGDITGTWLNGTAGAVGLYLTFMLDSGTTFLAPTAASWQAGDFVGVVNSVAFMGTLANTIKITNVQLAIGSTISPYEWLPFEQQFNLCMRYFEKSNNLYAKIGAAIDAANHAATGLNTVNNTSLYDTIYYKVEKALVGTVTTYPYTTPANTFRSSNGVGVDYGANSCVVNTPTLGGFFAQNSAGGALPVSTNQAIFFAWYVDSDLT